MKRLLSIFAAAAIAGLAMALVLFVVNTDVLPTQAQTLLDVTAIPDLIIDVQPHEETTLADSVISYTILYTNTLNRTLAGVDVVATLMSDQTYAGHYLSTPTIPTGSFTYTGNFDGGYELKWTIGSVGPYAHGTMLITTTVPAQAEPVWDDSKRWPILGASAAITTTTQDVTIGNPQGLEADGCSVMVVGPVLRITKTGSAPGVRPGHLLTYTLTLQNKDREDALPATGIVITDAIPVGTTFVSADSGGVLDAGAGDTGSVVWHLPGPLDPGGTLLVKFVVRAAAEPSACPPPKIVNDNLKYRVISAENLKEVVGATDVGTNVLDVLTKVIVTPPVPANVKQVFPGGIVTYTITIYNPLHDQALTGLRVVDTLPLAPEPFTFIRMVGGGPTPSVNLPEVVWENLTVPAGGTLSFSFLAQVPIEIPFAANQTSRTYNNALSATAPALTICDMKDVAPSQAVVVPQLWMEKTVNPTHVLSGQIVTYTITVENRGVTPIHSVRLTDTLPNDIVNGSAFRFAEMVSGPAPLPGYQEREVVWDNLTMPAGETTSLVFRAYAVGWPLAKYYNALAAISPETSIPPRTKRAAVLIDSPLTISKAVNPTATFVEQIVTYDVSVCNVATGTYTIDTFMDELPVGFYATATGSQSYEYDISPPAALEPGECWNHSFTVEVDYSAGCDKTVKNGEMSVHIVSPLDVIAYYSDATAPLRINPHITMQKSSDHATVLPGETVVYTVTVINGSTMGISGITVEDILPVGFEYAGMVSGPNPSSASGTQLTWQNVSLAGGASQVYVFRANVTADHALGTFYNDVNASTSALVCIEDLKPSAPVRVAEEIVELSKKVVPTSITPFGVVEYQLSIKNLDSLPIPGFVLTEILPSAALAPHFQFITMTLGPAPSEIAGQNVIWRDVTIPGNKQTLTLRFQARSAILLGTYENQVTAWCPRSGPIEREAGWNIEAPVTVLPGIVLYKTVYPTFTTGLEPVVYTVTLYNASTSVLDSVLITDTLPEGFSYRRMLEGAAPVQIGGNTVVWEIPSVAKSAVTNLVFEANVSASVITGTYLNKVSATSPSALIPDIETAPVYVEPGERQPPVYLPVVMRAHLEP